MRLHGLFRVFFLASLACALTATAQNCPINHVTGFGGDVTRNADGSCVPGGVVLHWDPYPSLAASASYDVLMSQVYPDYCSIDGSNLQFSIVGKTGNTSFTQRFPLNGVAVFAVQLTGCSGTRSAFLIGDSFTSPPAAPSLTATASGPGQISVSFGQPDGRTFDLEALERSKDGGAFVGVPNLVPGFKNYCPAGSTQSFVDTGLADGTYTYRVTNSGNTGSCLGGVSTTATVSIGCGTPGAPTLGGPQSVTSGRPVAFSWNGPPAFPPGSHYLFETSLDGFATIDRTYSTTGLSAVVGTKASSTDSTVSGRVRTVLSCGSMSLSSNVVNVRVAAAPASFVRKGGSPSLVAVLGGNAPSAMVTFKNTGAVGGTLSFTASSDFFRVDMPSAFVAPGAETTVKVIGNAGGTYSTSFLQGVLTAAWDGGSIMTPVTLRVVPNAISGARARATTPTILFSAPAGGSPDAQQLTINVSGGKIGVPVSLVPRIEPAGAWLNVGLEVGRDLSADDSLSLTLSVKRSRRSMEESSNLVRTLLFLTPYGGDPEKDGAVVEILDLDTLSPGPAAGLRGSAPIGGSIILPSAVRAISGVDPNQVFTSDGWIRSLASFPVTADVYCTVNGFDGLNSAGGLAKTSVTLPAFGTFRTADLMRTLFGANGVSANIELRSPFIGALSFRSTTDSVKGGDPVSRFGTEIPAVSFGSGVSLGEPELMVTGVDSDARNRSNLILAETFGAAATAQITVNGPDGSLLRTITQPVPALSKIQINGADLVPDGTSGGWVGVSVVAGAGHLVPVATIIDNASGSFSAVLGQVQRSAQAAKKRPLAAGPLRYLMPTAVRLTGANNTAYTTSMSMVNGTAQNASLTFTYRYTDLDDGNQVKTAVQSRVIPPRGTFPKNLGADILASFFGVTHRSFGSIYVDGDVTKVTGVVAVSTAVDPGDPSKGVKTSQVPGVFLDSPSIMPKGAVEHRFTGLEKSTQRRSNLVLLEVDGQPATVTVRLSNANGDSLGEQTFSVGPGEYKQVTDIFGSSGVNAGDGPFQDIEVSATVVSGTGRVLALASIIDNISFNPEVFILTPPAPPPDPTIGF